MTYIISNNIIPKSYITKESFLNAIKITTIMGGSTNVVIHLLAMAKEFDINLSLEDFETINNNYPILSNLKPHGKYVIYDIYKSIGGFPVILKYLIDNKLINFTILKDNNEINIFFDINNFNLVGWQTLDIYQNLNITYLSSLKKNQMLKKNIFKLPKID